MFAAYLRPEAAMEIFGRDRKAVLAWGPGPARAVVVPGGYRVTGNWSFASGGRHATWLGAHCPVFESDGTPRLAADGSAVLRTVRVSRRRGRDERYLGRHRPQGHGERRLRRPRLLRSRSSCRGARRPGGAALSRPALRLPDHQSLRRGLCRRRPRHRPRDARRLHPAHQGEDAARPQGRTARERGDPVAGGAVRGAAERGAALPDDDAGGDLA